jgi:putative endonuclease
MSPRDDHPTRHKKGNRPALMPRAGRLRIFATNQSSNPGPWSNGMTAESHSANRGSIPRGSIRLAALALAGRASSGNINGQGKGHSKSNSSESNALSKRPWPELVEGSASKGYLPMASAPADSFFVYVLRCSDGSLYVGHTSNLQDRLTVHNEGRGAAWTACRRPVELVYNEPFVFEKNAIVRERQIKRWTHAKKLALINGNLGKLKSLAKRRVW